MLSSEVARAAVRVPGVPKEIVERVLEALWGTRSACPPGDAYRKLSGGIFRCAD